MGELKVLVLGDGLLGSELVKQTGWDYISRKAGTLDIDDFWNSFPKNKFLEAKHDVIINCVANTNTYSTNKEAHWHVNVQFVDSLIDYCNSNKIKLVHISTDYVYAGSVNNASEEDVPVHCNTWYGYTKLLSDGLVQLRSDNHLVIRCTHKPKPFPYEAAWIDQVGNFDYVDVIASLIIKAVNHDLNGLYNLGTDVKTMHELASETAKVDKSFTPAHVPKNQSMDVSKLWKDLSSQ
jgi:dTDP-4-dehydrorhamnose reductase